MELRLKRESERVIEGALASGRYQSAEEVVDSALGLLERAEESRKAFQAEMQRRIAEAENGEVFTLGEVVEHLRHQDPEFQIGA